VTGLDGTLGIYSGTLLLHHHSIYGLTIFIKSIATQLDLPDQPMMPSPKPLRNSMSTDKLRYYDILIYFLQIRLGMDVFKAYYFPDEWFDKQFKQMGEFSKMSPATWRDHSLRRNCTATAPQHTLIKKLFDYVNTQQA
jgi:hypothetical protein